MAIDSLATDGLELMWVAVVALVTLLAGVSIGYLIGAKKGGQKSKIVELEAALADKDQELSDYRAEVVNQFSQTAEKFKTLDESYHALHRQLATSAVSLCGDQATPLLAHADAPTALAVGVQDALEGEAEALDATDDFDQETAEQNEVQQQEDLDEQQAGQADSAEAENATGAQELAPEDDDAPDDPTDPLATDASPEVEASELVVEQVQTEDVDVPILTEDVSSEDDGATKTIR